MAKNITAANIVATIVADLLYPTGRIIEGFAEDNLRSLDDLTLTESIMGVDGRLSHGAVKYPTVIRFALMPDQPGYDVFENIAQVQQTTLAPIILSLIIVDQSLNKKYTLLNGVLSNWKPMPDAGRLIAAQEATLIFESCTTEQYGA